jgi:hypothetical protein
MKILWRVHALPYPYLAAFSCLFKAFHSCILIAVLHFPPEDILVANFMAQSLAFEADSHSINSQVLMVVTIKRTVFWYVMPVV